MPVSYEEGYSEAQFISMLKDTFGAIEITDKKEFVKGMAGLTNNDSRTRVAPTMARGSSLIPKEDERVAFWTGAEDVRNAKVEEVVINHFLTRPNTLSVRDVREYQVPWSIEVVGKRKTEVQHIRILCEHDVRDVLNLPYEIERIDPKAIEQHVGWGEHPGIDFLVFISAQTWVMRIVHRGNYTKFVLDMLHQGVQYPKVTRRIPKDNFGRSANGIVIPLQEIADQSGIILEESLLNEQE